MMYDENIARFLNVAAEMLRTEAVTQTAPVVTGKLRADISVIPEPSPHAVSVGNSPLIAYARYVYYGTKPHTISPKRKKALKTPYGVFKKVNHPGTRSNKYLDLALERLVSSGRLERLLEGFGEEMSEEIFENVIRSLKHIRVK